MRSSTTRRTWIERLNKKNRLRAGIARFSLVLVPRLSLGTQLSLKLQLHPTFQFCET